MKNNRDCSIAQRKVAHSLIPDLICRKIFSLIHQCTARCHAPMVISFSLLFISCSILHAAPGVVSNHPITPPITDKGVVRVIFHVLGDSVSGGVVICQDSMYNPDPASSHPPLSWKFMAGIVRMDNINKCGNDSIEFFEGSGEHGKGSYNTGMQTMLWAKGDTICAWFEIDVHLRRHSVYLQKKSDSNNERIKCAENYPTRNQLFTEINMLQSIGNIYNNKPYGVEVIDVVRTELIEFIDPYNYNIIPANKSIKSHRVYPTVVNNVIYISSEAEVAKVGIYCLTGNLMMNSTNTTIDLSFLKPGSYIVTIMDTAGTISNTKIIKN